MTKKFNFKLPSMIALTLFGAAFTTQQAHAAENNQNSSNSTNIIDDQESMKTAEQAKKEVSNSAQNVSGVQTYQHPSEVKANVASNTNSYDAKLDDLNNSNHTTSSQETPEVTANSNANNSNDNQVAVDNHQATASNESTSNTNDKSVQATNQTENASTQDEATVNKNDVETNSTQYNAQSDKKDSTEVSDNNAQDKANLDTQASETNTNKEQASVATPSAQNEQKAQSNIQSFSAENHNTATDNQQQATQNKNTTTNATSKSNEKQATVAQNNDEDRASNQGKETTNTNTSVAKTNPVAPSSKDNRTETVTTTNNNNVKPESKNNSVTNETAKVPTNTTTHAKSNVDSNLINHNAKAEKQAPTTRATSTYATRSTASSAKPTGRTSFRAVGGKGGGPNTSVRAVSRYAKTTALPKYKPQVNSSINNYIRSNKFQAPRIEEDYSSYFPKYGYRNGVGKPEGIVVHDTANDNSNINGEISYMKNNYNSAFVHAFVDGNRIIETAPTDYLSWGAGPNANNRFINVEIVHTHDYASFAKSMNNYADYAATQLQYYNLKPNSAENDGQGTVWTHYAISKYLGGTDHSDPHAYLQSHNYSYNELYDLINEKYLIKTGQVAPWGYTSTSGSSTSGKGSGSNSSGHSSGSTTTNTNSKLSVKPNSGLAQIKSNNSGVYTTVYDSKGHSTDQVHNTLAVTKSATLGKDKYYLVSDYNSGKLYGWVKQGETVYNTVKSPVKLNKSYNIKSGSTLYTVPWGNYNQVAGTVSKSNKSPFKATKSQQVGKATYLYGSVNGTNGWVSKAYLSDLTKAATSTPKAENIFSVANVKNTLGQVSAKNKGTYTTVYDKTAKPNASIGGKTYSISKKATLNNQNYYLISDFNGGTLRGWVPASEIKVQSTTPTKTDVTYYNVKGNAHVYDTPWGSSKQVKASVPSDGKQLKAIDELKVGNETYLHGVVNNVWGWVNSSDIQQAPKMNLRMATRAQATNAQPTTQTVSKIAQVKPNNSGIRATVYDKVGKHATKYANRTYKVSKERTIGDNTYVLLQSTSKKTPLGWYNVKDLNLQNSSSEQKTSGTYTVNHKNNGLYSVAWGTPQQRLDNKDLANKPFKVSKSVVIGNTTYLFGTVNGKAGWIAKNDLVANSDANNAEDYQYEFIIDSNNGFYYDSPTSAKATALKAYNEQIFQVTQRKVINGKTWYYGKLSNGKYVWIKDSDLKKQLVKQAKTHRTLDQATAIQQNAYGAPPQVQRDGHNWHNATYSEIKNAMDTQKIAKDDALKYQFLRLDRPQNLPVAQINTLLKGKGILENQGQAFSEAAATSGINEVYLIAHALIETGNGQSQLAKGANIVNNVVNTKSATKYHNVFGIAAFDSNPLANGISYAKKAGWNSISKAIIGGAKFIGQDYIKAGQNTLYKMRWNPNNPGTHQYATDINWANSNAQYLKQLYDQIKTVGKYFEIPSFTK